MTALRHLILDATPDRSVRRHVWQDDAACTDTDTASFYPEDLGRGKKRAAEFALSKCAVCPVVAECLAHDDGWGIRGGLTERERLAIRKGEK